jgi:lysozyme family protein
VSVDKIINGVIDREGEAFTNDPADLGGPTKFGITLTTLARARGTPVTAADVERLTRSEAMTTYEWLFVQKPGFDRIIGISAAVGEQLIDMGVNMGPAIATIVLQRLLNALNNEERHYRDLKVDGDCGPATGDALRTFLKTRGNEGLLVLLRGIAGLQIARYVDITEHRPANEKFLYGWLRTRTGLTS